MGGVKSSKEDKVRNVVMGGVKTGTVGKLENCKIDEEMWCQTEEKLCKSIIKGLARGNHERHTMLADGEEEQEQDVICFDDITGKELPWHAVRRAREWELKYLRDLGVFEKVDEKEAVAKYGITPVDTKWVDTDKAFEGEPMQIRSRMCAREFKSDDRTDLYAGTPPLEASKARSQRTTKNVFNHAHRCVTCVLPREGPETRADTATRGGQSGHRRWEYWIDEEEHVRNEQRSQQLGARLARHVKNWGFQLGLSSKNLFHHKENRVSEHTVTTSCSQGQPRN